MARFYEQRAKELERWARQHQKMAEHALHYVPLKSVPGFTQHCKSLADSYQASAKENLGLAKLHRRLTAEAPQ